MADFGKEFSELGIEIIDTAGNVIDGFGNTYQSNSIANQAQAQRMGIQNQLMVQEAQQSQRQKEQMQKLTNTIVYSMIAIISIFVISKIYQNLK